MDELAEAIWTGVCVAAGFFAGGATFLGLCAACLMVRASWLDRLDRAAARRQLSR